VNYYQRCCTSKNKRGNKQINTIQTIFFLNVSVGTLSRVIHEELNIFKNVLVSN